MASWKDGAAYASTERPDGFAAPVADPLPVAEPHAAVTPGAGPHPADFRAEEQRPLTDLGDVAVAARDPREEFTVASLSMTASEPTGGHRDPREAFSLSTASIGAPGPPPPVGDPLPLAPPRTSGRDQPSSTPTAIPQETRSWAPPGQVPQVGTSRQWAPPTGTPQGQRPAQPNDPTRLLCWVAAGLSLFGVLLPGAAPLLLIVAGAIGLRTVGRTSSLGVTALIVGIAAVVFQLLNGSLGQGGMLTMLFSISACVWFIVGALRR
ncbi:hypothetical protein SAMN02745244_03277 [Tessaracoccus bendigoensis DSM 12906]|uniref:Uncharacterized protein n=1 Tax=Tessaracoccus bendigoensis DSM 12906 TaxID=1123357 RepID=A0A1M6M7J3_9ACTN|nr:hypothetical protein [Tessaracoccus bendigoensis]SHJ79432.1 hypothetical protein SAMN02745244_03277 [Tessaracoccus bendigoensis DSM 12906]